MTEPASAQNSFVKTLDAKPEEQDAKADEHRINYI
jgi:hypothetical protein